MDYTSARFFNLKCLVTLLFWLCFVVWCRVLVIPLDNSLRFPGPKKAQSQIEIFSVQLKLFYVHHVHQRCHRYLQMRQKCTFLRSTEAEIQQEPVQPQIPYYTLFLTVCDLSCCARCKIKRFKGSCHVVPKCNAEQKHRNKICGRWWDSLRNVSCLEWRAL